ncbi:MAG TPA: uracil-DNA glycosylase [Casimicrobiaceae bacterium]|nr:uracil-DNA glycosylase [Casimicrobiaceae bacterium]
MAERIDILQELGLTPLWRLRAQYRSDAMSMAPHAAKEPPLAAPQVDAVNESPQAGLQNRVTRIATLDWAHFAADVSACTACGLARTRNKTVPGVGDVRAEWLFVGEAPGAEEDARGEPFVGQGGRLLDSMLAALGMNRIKAVYIANVLKCRPPGNRAPTPLEVEACLPYLDRQIALIQPKLIVALGKSAATTLLRVEATIASLRGRVHRYKGVPLIVTYHPAYLLRNLPDKAKAWEDLCLARATLRGILDAGHLQTPGRLPS